MARTPPHAMMLKVMYLTRGIRCSILFVGYAQTRYPEDESMIQLDTDWTPFKEDASPK